ncbi:corrinoid protein [Neomoorella thermoacetica]|uniref:corrinoid protein n=1 Tax=Neomoorella thermoacetica TaxID=1525 RepID=UPI0008FB5D9C|nr:corrinoid protein [Moorella thermoacetica]OIQ54686.1 methionine synthase [Moorella thermoacetica]
MPQEKKELLQALSDAVFNMEVERAADLARECVDAGIDPFEAIEKGLIDGINRAGVLFEEEEYFVPELLLCSDAMYAGLDVLRPHLPETSETQSGRVVMGVVEGDTHDIGKNLVKIMLEANGFEVIDLGRDVPPQQFVEKARETGAAFIGLSTLMTTTMARMEEVINRLKEEQIREQYKVVVGGGPISQGFASRIGADGYAVNAVEAVKLFRRLQGA